MQPLPQDDHRSRKALAANVTVRNYGTASALPVPTALQYRAPTTRLARDAADAGWVGDGACFESLSME